MRPEPRPTTPSNGGAALGRQSRRYRSWAMTNCAVPQLLTERGGAAPTSG
ncbi:hypothetical protein BZL30_2544 [Mycobacterium kansasii]|uniref:Uncharacterized protein n=1 Tax=Mycobacterium kansasii TaxID=1768 RepID=A0A1V3XJ27_MYCKA|nr:hypothetical protein BZL30_2544 [Mycobacterium kansasii]